MDMALIKSTDNKSTERKFIAMLRRLGVRGWSIQPDWIEGRPDLAFVDEKVAVFLDGCFWHMCPDHFKTPKTNRAKWLKKIRANTVRDEKVLRALIDEGWKVFRVWEHDIADADTLKGIAMRVARAADTPDDLEFGRAVNVLDNGRLPSQRGITGRRAEHPISWPGSFHTRWRALFESEDLSWR